MVSPLPNTHPHKPSPQTIPIAYIHTYVNTYIHTYVCTYIHTSIHTYVHTYMPIPTNLRKYIHTTPNPPHKGGRGEDTFFWSTKN